MITHLVLPDACVRQFETEARAAAPRECCGLVQGVVNGGMAQAQAFHPARNLAGRADRFEIDPADQFRLLHSLRSTSQAMIGCYHSHPGGKPEPSAFDLAGAGEQGFVWLIAGVGPGRFDLAAFVFEGSGFSPIRLTSA